MRYGRRNGIQLAKPLDDKLLKKMFLKNTKVIVQPKLDGERCRALIDAESEQCVLLSSEENIIKSVPHINAAIISMWRKLPEDIKIFAREFDGELYNHGFTFEQIHSIVSRKTNLHEKRRLISFYMFDIVLDCEERCRRYILSKLPEVEYIEKVLTMYSDYETIPLIMDNMVDMGYEGVIIRDPLALYQRKRIDGMLKFKPTKSDSYLIVGIEEALRSDGSPTGRAGAIICLDHDLKTRFNVSISLPHSVCEVILENAENVKGKFVTVVYQSLTSQRGVPRFGRAIEISDMNKTEYTNI